MKRIFVTALLLFLIHSYSSAQVFSTRPFASSTAPTGSSLHDLLIAMNQDSVALHVHPGDGRALALGSDFNFMYTHNGSTFNVEGGVWSAGHQFGSGNVINFTRIENVSIFKLNGILEIGYIGGINGSSSELHLNAYADYRSPGDGNSRQLLYDYGGDSPLSYSIRLDPGTTQSDLVFEHIAAGSSTVQSDPGCFKIFSGINPDGSMTGEYLLTVSSVDDGLYSGSGLGMFYMIGDASPVTVPEPSSYCLVLSLVLGAGIGVRRLRKG